MHVLNVALNGYFWDQPRTGSGQYLRHLYGALTDLAPRSAHVDRVSLSLLLPGRESMVAARSEKLSKLLWEQWRVPAEARRRRAHLLHVPYLAPPLRQPLPVVVTAHDVIPWVVPGYAGSPAMRLYLALAASGARRARLIIADSEASRRDAIRVLRVPPSRVRTVYLGIEQHPDYTPAQLDDVRARFGLPRDFAFYIGGFDRRKNVPLLLRAWRRAANALTERWCAIEKPVLAIGGRVPEPGGIFPDVRGLAARMGLNTAGGDSPVRFLGPIEESDKPLLMAAARLFVYPSAYEGFGLDPLEAMSVGTPVVSSSGGSLREVVGDGGLLVPPTDEAALHEAIMAAWTDDPLRARLNEKGKAQARRFTWQRTAEQTLALYRQARNSE
jgi:glycosyltransferase involved in cell wall biosynthesis